MEEAEEEEELLQRQSGFEMLAQTSLAGALREVVVKSSRSASVTRDPELEGITCVGCQRTCKYRRDRLDGETGRVQERESKREKERVKEEGESKKENEFKKIGKSEGQRGRVKERE